MSNKYIDYVKSGKVITTFNANECGVLWEHLWKWSENDGYRSKVCCSGLFCDWMTYDSKDEFLSALNKDIEQYRIRSL